MTFGLGSLGASIFMIYLLFANPTAFEQTPIWFVGLLWVVLLALSLGIVVFTFSFLAFLDMISPSLQKRLNKFSHVLNDTKEAIVEGKQLKRELLMQKEELQKMKQEIHQIHSTEPCLALRDMVTQIAESDDPTPSKELRDDIVRLQTKVETLASLHREDSEKITKLESEIKKLKEEKEESEIIIADKFQGSNKIEDSKP